MATSTRVTSRSKCPAATIPKTVPTTRKPSVCRLTDTLAPRLTPTQSDPQPYPKPFGLAVFLRRDGEAGHVLKRVGVMEGRGCQRLVSFGIVAILGLFVLPLHGNGEVFCQPNIFGGHDCTGPEGRSSSRPNIFRGFDTTFSDGSRSSSRLNIFGGEDIYTPKGTIESRPNVFGGRDYRLPDGERSESQSNIFGGQDFRLPGGVSLTCRPNVFGGQDCR